MSAKIAALVAILMTQSACAQFFDAMARSRQARQNQNNQASGTGYQYTPRPYKKDNTCQYDFDCDGYGMTCAKGSMDTRGVCVSKKAQGYCTYNSDCLQGWACVTDEYTTLGYCREVQK